MIPGNTEVFFGDVLPITAEIRGPHDPHDVQLIYSTDDGQHTNVPVPMNSAGPYRYEIDLKTSGSGIQQNLRYKIVARDGESPWYSVKVKPFPAVSINSLKLVPPKYTKLAERLITGTGEVDGVEGTRVYIDATANLPIQSAYVEFLKIDRDDPDNMLVIKTEKLEFSDQNITGTFLLTLNSERNGPFCTHYQIRYQSTDGDLNSKPNVYPIRVTPDFAPELDVLAPKSNEVLLPVNGTLSIQVEATDVDYEISGLSLQMDNQGIRILNHEFELPEGDRHRVRQTYWLVPEKLSLKPGDKATFFAMAKDNRHSPYGDILDPNVTRSENFTITITEADESIDEKQRDKEIERAEQEQKQNNQNDSKQEDQENDGSASDQEQDGSEGDQEENTDSTTNDSDSNNQDDEESSENENNGTGGTSDPSETNEPEDDNSQNGGSEGNNSDSNDQQTSDQSSEQDNNNEQNDGSNSNQENESSQGDGSNNQQTNEGEGEGNSSQQGSGEGRNETSDGGPSENTDRSNGDSNQGQPENPSAGNDTNGQQSEGQGEGQRDENLQDGSVRDDATDGERMEELRDYFGEKNKQNQPESNDSSQENSNDQDGANETTDQSNNSDNESDANNQNTDPSNPNGQQGDQENNSDSENSSDGNQSDNGNDSDSTQNQNAPNSSGNNSENQNSENSNNPNQQNSENEQSSSSNDSTTDKNGNNNSDGNSGQNTDQNPSGNQDQTNSQNQDETGNQGNESNSDQSQEGNGQSENNSNQESNQQGNPSEQSGNSQQSDSSSSNQESNGSAQQPTANSSGSNTGSGAEEFGQTNPGDPNGTGNRVSDNPEAAQNDREFEQAKRERENIEHAKNATDLVLDELRKQAANPDPELLERMNWTEEELRDFLKSWEQMKNAAGNSEREKRLYESRLKSLGLTPPNPSARQLEGERDDLHGLSEDGAVNRPPADWSERYNRFQRLRNRAERE